jgi:enamine deaminase RidA (YjgF/YER057c/UK114 family)
MKAKKHNPKKTHKPLGKYTHGVEVGPGARWLHISGQVGIGPNGKLARGIKAQCDRAFRNLLAVLAEADMEVGDIVKTTVFLTRAEDIAAYRGVRDKHLGRAKPASTLLVISALASPDILVEVEATAAKG